MTFLLFNPNGRIASGPFWTGIVVLLGVYIVFSAVSVYAPLGVSSLLGLLSVGFIYPFLCVYAKRLHDAGKSAWWFALALVGWLVAGGVAGQFLTAPHMAEIGELAFGSPEFADAMMDVQRRVWIPSLAISTGLSLAIAYVVASLKSDPQENIHGPPTTPGTSAVV